jgi:hypothetical protein
MKNFVLAGLILLIGTYSQAQDWENVGTQGITSGQNGRALIEWDGKLVMAGKFTELEGASIKNIGIWDGSSWSELGDGIQGDVRCMAIYNGELYIGGNISQNGLLTTDLPSVCKLSNGVWVGVSDENVVGIADDMMVWDGALYVVSNDWSLPNKIIKYDGASWTQVGGDVGQYGDNHSIACVDTFNNELYIGGRFADLGIGGANRIAKLNGNNWESVGFPTSGVENNIIKGWVNDLISFNGKLFAGGSIFDFTGGGGTDKPRLASYDGTTWTGYPFDQNNVGEVNTLLEYDNVLYVGGEFGHWEQSEIANGVLIFNEMDENKFMTTGFYNPDGSSNTVDHLAVISGSVYAAGDFENFGTAGTSEGIAKFNGVLPLPFTSIFEPTSNQVLQVYPNPTTDLITIGGVDEGRVSVFSVAGQRLIDRPMTISSRNLDLNTLDAGVYSIVLDSEDGRFVQTVVLQ